jgi:hypothetical protein
MLSSTCFQLVAICDHILERLIGGDPREYVSTRGLKELINCFVANQEQSGEHSNSDDS